jgi:hypothetical protein
MLSEDEIKFEKDYQQYAPCRTCIDLSNVEADDTDQLDFLDSEELVTGVDPEGFVTTDDEQAD